MVRESRAVGSGGHRGSLWPVAARWGCLWTQWALVRNATAPGRCARASRVPEQTHALFRPHMVSWDRLAMAWGQQGGWQQGQHMCHWPEPFLPRSQSVCPWAPRALLQLLCQAQEF